jgi:hypothetical protein
MKAFKDKPAALDWDDAELRSYLRWIKHNENYKILYNKSKRVIHGVSYGLSAYGLRLTYPSDFSSVKDAENTLALFFGLFPKIKIWQANLHKRAYEDKYLGLNEHPFRYRHYFFDIYTFKKVSRGEAKAIIANGGYCIEADGQWLKVEPGTDYKRAIALFPQSTAGGNLREAMLRLFVPGSPWYVGDIYYGKTPLRMPIHDSLVLEVPKSRLDNTIEKVYKAMTHPVIQQPCPDEWDTGEYLTKEQLDYLEATNQLTNHRGVMERTRYLTIDVEIEKGLNWSEMEEVDI